MSSALRTRVILAAKVLLAAALVAWLLRSGALDPRSLGVLLARPLLLAAGLALFVVSIFAGALRWSVLLRLAHVRIPYWRAVQLQATSVFFNTAIPGNVGGDLVKSGYAAREAAPAMRPTVFLIVFLERLLGLGALVLFAGIVIAARGLWHDPKLRDPSLAVAALAVVTVAGPTAGIVLVRVLGDRLERWTRGSSRPARLASMLVASARLVSAGPKNLAFAVLLSMGVHAMAMLFFTALTLAITAQDVPFSSIASVFPIGLLTLILPISPGGIGVGHVAFDRLFTMIGLTGGASVFNAYLVMQLAPALLGVFPYLTLKRSHALPTEAETDVAAE
ncbi:MAG: hypothetical protein JWP97_2747 [Labilithrix sp.]|nr:hypothetical protein [Labilithrix sp.]